METRRSIKELLQLMLDNQDYFIIGMCNWIHNLLEDNLINKEEHRILYRYIQSNRPSIFSSIDAFLNRNNLFYWKSCDINPRLKWIKKHIKKFS
ncbi:MAG TPA: hypothetical protein PKD00_10535 [Burkholderiales bacterium]|nr:hypothetical protein [Burkholderiales bacterium]